MSSPVPPADHDALPPGTRFGELEIRHVVGVGGFGIVYLAYDHALERDVALKEYMPSSLASRGQGSVITVRSAAHAETYAVGLRSFVNEARMLARFDHPSMVKVYRFWEDNGTAYMVMPYLEGRTLRDARKAMAAPPDEAWIRSVLDPVLSAVELLHREGVYHRDIAPDNILLLPGDRPILLDFGAARRVISDRTQSLTAILKPSYAPIEQYAEMATLRQGPWTDLYAFAAVIHFLLFGVPPSPATARAVHDDLRSVTQASLPGVSPQFLAATAWALAVKPADRPQSAAEFRAALDGRTVPPPVAAPPADNAWDRTVQVGPGGTAATMPIARGITAAAPGGTAPPRAAAAPPPAAAARAAAAPLPTPSSGGRGALVGGSIAAAVVVAAVAGWFVLSGRPAAPAAEAPAAAAPAPTTAPIAAPTTAPTSAAVAAPPVAEAPAAAPAPAAVVAPAAAPATTTLAAPAAPAPAPVAAPAARTEAAPRPAAAPPRSDATTAARPTPRSGDSGALQPRPAPLREAVVEAPARPAAPAIEPSPSSTVSVAAPVTAAPPPAAAPALPTKSAGPASAREACGSRVLIALAICMDRQCARPEFAGGADCRKFLDDKRRRDQQRGMPAN
jgi:hypothetical protein